LTFILLLHLKARREMDSGETASAIVDAASRRYAETNAENQYQQDAAKLYHDVCWPYYNCSYICHPISSLCHSVWSAKMKLFYSTAHRLDQSARVIAKFTKYYLQLWDMGICSLCATSFNSCGSLMRPSLATGVFFLSSTATVYSAYSSQPLLPL